MGAAVRDELFALLEDGPKKAAQLATWLGSFPGLVRYELRRMRADGIVRQIKGGAWEIGKDEARAVVRPEAGRCRNCRVKWAQYKGLCRRCERTVGVVETVPDRPAPTLATPLPSGPRTRVVDGQEFDVVFSGADSLIGDVAGMNSALSSPGCRVHL